MEETTLIGNLKKQNRIKVMLTTFVMVIVLFVCGCGGSRVTKANFDKIKNGMSFNEVVAILGDDYEVSSSAGFGSYYSSCYIWEGLFGANITIIFLNNQVYSKAQAGL